MSTLRGLRLYYVVLLAITAVACSEQTTAIAPSDPPGLQPTFGTSASEGVRGMAVTAAGVFVVGDTEGSLDGQLLGLQDAFARRYHSQGDLLWRSQFGTHISDVAVGVAADDAGNAYVCGGTEASLAGSRGSNDAILRKYSASGAVQWTRQFGSSAYDNANACAVDKFGNIYVVGTTSGKVGQDPSNGGNDVFVAKYDANGADMWTRQFGTSSSDGGGGVAVDAAGNVYVAGSTNGALAAANLGGYDVFLRKYDSNGTALWTSQFGTTSYEQAHAVAVDANGAIIVAGQTDGTLEGTNQGGTDGFVRKFDATGNVVATDQFGTSASDYARAVAADDEGNAYVTGWTLGAFGRTSLGAADVFVRKYNSSTTAVWTRQFGTSDNDLGLAIGVRQSNAIYVAGGTYGTLVGQNRGAEDAFLRQLNTAGQTVWTDQ